MRTVTAHRRHQSLIADHVHATLTVKFALAEAVLLVTLLADIVDDALLARLPLLVLGLYLVKLYLALGTCVSFLGPDLNAFLAIPMLAPV